MMINKNIRPKITTIIPTYRRPDLLKRAIRSVLSQTYIHFQLYVYDNASHDETSKIVADLSEKDSRVNYYCHSENIGAIANFNYGLSKVETDFFSLLSDDDILLPNFYETTLEGFEKYPKAMFSAGEVIEINEEKEFVRARLSLWSREGIYYPPDGLLEMLGKEPVWTGILFRKEITQKIGLLDPEVGNALDLDFELRIASLYPICISKHPCAILVDHSSSLSTHTKLGTYWVGWFRMISKLMKNTQIPLDVRLRSEQKLKDQLIGFMFRTRALSRRDFDDAYETAEILNKVLGQKWKATILIIVTMLTKSFPPFYYLLVWTRRLVRRINSRRKAKHFENQFDNYLRLLEET